MKLEVNQHDLHIKISKCILTIDLNLSRFVQSYPQPIIFCMGVFIFLNFLYQMSKILNKCV